MWCVSEGNKKIPQRLLKRANVNLIKSKVSAISIHPTEHFTRYELVSDVHKNIYDIVILAAPLHDGIADISFVGFNESITEFPDHYHRTVATFVRGLPHFTKFGYQTLHQFPDIVLSTNNKVFFNSMGKIHPIHKYASTYKDKQELSVWKVFSQRHLTENEMNELFVSHEEVRVVDWKAAYPHYSSSQVNLPSFRLANQLYYVNAIELAASAMEMLAIGGRNVALLAHNEWFDKDDLVDPYVDGQFGRQEL
jgi:prenylcysteine oxidase/farnesylcysteine lyase